MERRICWLFSVWNFVCVEGVNAVEEFEEVKVRVLICLLRILHTRGRKHTTWPITGSQSK
jgi:hypothetical protein